MFVLIEFYLQHITRFMNEWNHWSEKGRPSWQKISWWPSWHLSKRLNSLPLTTVGSASLWTRIASWVKNLLLSVLQYAIYSKYDAEAAMIPYGMNVYLRTLKPGEPPRVMPSWHPMVRASSRSNFAGIATGISSYSVLRKPAVQLGRI